MDIKTNSSAESQRALVLGGGGSAGNAWLIGIIAGLFDAGLDLTKTDLIIGTSAGATVAAQISSVTQPPELFARILAEVHQQKPDPNQSNSGSIPVRPAGVNPMQITNEIIRSASDAADMRSRMGAWALGTEATLHNFTHKWRAIVAARLPTQQWPPREIFLTAVNAHTGEPVVFDRHSGVDLVDAVASSCASSFAYAIGDSYYIDGGYRTNADNADLAAGYGQVLILSPFGGKSRTPVEWGTHLSTQVEQLSANGSIVETIFPDSATIEGFGDNMMDLSRRPLCAQAGYDQGRALAGYLMGFWH